MAKRKISTYVILLIAGAFAGLYLKMGWPVTIMTVALVGLIIDNETFAGWTVLNTHSSSKGKLIFAYIVHTIAFLATLMYVIAWVWLIIGGILKLS